jgi:hypothetical protein
MKVTRIPQLRLSAHISFVSSRSWGIGTFRTYSVHQRTFDDSTSSSRPKVTLAHLRKMYMTNQKIAVMTAHDYPSGTFADRGGSDIVLVGDSLGMVCLGYESTNLVTLSVPFPF